MMLSYDDRFLAFRASSRVRVVTAVLPSVILPRYLAAALGGLLVDRISFEATFRITAVVYVLATLILALVIPLTAGEKVDDTPVASSKADASDSISDSTHAAAAIAAKKGKAGDKFTESTPLIGAVSP